MSTSKKADTDQKQFWHMVIETFKASNLSVRQFCKQEGLTEPSFYSWRKKLTINNESTSKKKNNSRSLFLR